MWELRLLNNYHRGKEKRGRRKSCTLAKRKDCKEIRCKMGDIKHIFVRYAVTQLNLKGDYMSLLKKGQFF